MTPTEPLRVNFVNWPRDWMEKLEKAYHDCVGGADTPKAYACSTETFTQFIAPPGVLTITRAPTYGCGWVDLDGIGHHQIRRSADDGVLLYIRRGKVIYDAAEACP